MEFWIPKGRAGAAIRLDDLEAKIIDIVANTLRLLAWEAVLADLGVALLAIMNAVRIQRMDFGSVQVIADFSAPTSPR